MKKNLFVILITCLSLMLVPCQTKAETFVDMTLDSPELIAPAPNGGLEVTYTVVSSTDDNGQTIILEHKIITFDGTVISDTIEVTVCQQR